MTRRGVADLARVAVAGVQPPAEDDAGGDAGADREVDHVAHPARRADARLGERGGPDVVAEDDRQPAALVDLRGERHVAPVEVLGPHRHATLFVDDARDGEADRLDRPPRLDELRHGVDDPRRGRRRGPRAEVERRGVVVHERRLHVGAADVDGDHAGHQLITDCPVAASASASASGPASSGSSLAVVTRTAGGVRRRNRSPASTA